MYMHISRSHDPHYNLALEEYILTRETAGDFFLLWRNGPSVILGLNQCAAEEADLSLAAVSHLPVIRRTTGGGAVYHDLGNVNFSFVTDTDFNFPLGPFTEPIIAYLKSLGLDAAADGRNDITVQGRKISGNAYRIEGRRILHHGTLLFSSDLNALSRALKPRDDKFCSKSTKSVRSRVANISELLAPQAMTVEEFMDGLVRSMNSRRALIPWSPSAGARAEISRLASEKYASPQWNLGLSPACNFKNRRRFQGGELEIQLMLSHGHGGSSVSSLPCIDFAAIRGDFMAAAPPDAVTGAITGAAYSPGAVARALNSLPQPWEHFLGGITREEFLSVCFPQAVSLPL